MTPAMPTTCPDCAKARAKYDRLDARMSARGNFGIVPLPRTCKKHAKQSQIVAKEHNDKLCFIYALDRAIEFHRTNTNDPHNVGNAVIAALSEVRDAFKAYMI